MRGWWVRGEDGVGGSGLLVDWVGGADAGDTEGGPVSGAEEPLADGEDGGGTGFVCWLAVG